MSLINEALRKARQAAAEHDDQRMAGRPPQAYPSRGPRRGVGPAFVVLVAVVAGLAGAAGVWWIVGTAATEQPPTETPALQGRAETDSADRASDLTADAEAEGDVGGVTPSQEQPERGSETPPPTKSADADPEAEVLEPEPLQAPQPSKNAEAVAAPAGVRVFIMDAELGYASLSLGYIVFRPVRPFAEINGKDVYEGSEIGGFTVEKIEIDHVLLRDDRGPLELRVP